MEEKQSVENSGKVNKVNKKKNTYKITVPANNKGKHILPFMNFLRVLVIPAYFLVMPFRFFGKRKAPEGACIYVGNHYTLMDVVFMASTTWECVHFVGKRAIFDSKFLGGFARGIKAIPVARDGSDVRAMLDCLKCLKNGEKIAIYPEGKRNKTDAEILPFKHGAAAMAIKTKVPVIPLVMYKRPKLFHCTHVLVGEPIDLSEYYDVKLTEEELVKADEKIRETMLKMKAEHKAFLESKKKGKKS